MANRKTAVREIERDKNRDRDRERQKETETTDKSHRAVG